MQRNHNTDECKYNTLKFYGEVKKLAERYNFEVSDYEVDGKGLDKIITWRIDNAKAGVNKTVVEVKIKGIRIGERCIITDEKGISTEFEGPISECEQESLAHIETLLKKSQQSNP